MRTVVAVMLVSLGGAGARAQQSPPPYRDAMLPVERRVADLLGRMTLEEKFWQLFMIPGGREDATHDHSHGVFGLQNRTAASALDDARLHNALQRYFIDSTRLGIPIIPFEEAVHGLMRRGAAVYPQAIAQAATFDSALVGRVAAAIAVEARVRGIRQVLSPVVNIANDVRWGRVEETYGEDPYLSSVMGRAFVREFERRGVIATPKHFVANVGEGGRDSYPVDASRRLLEEIHFPPFRSAIGEAGARSIMTSYNSVDGLPMSQHAPLLNGVLKRDWGFAGFVISDQSAVGGATVLHHTEASTATATKRAIEGGLDVIFQSSWPQHRPYLEAFRRGQVAPAAIDSAVARVLRAKFQLGLFEQPDVDPDSAARVSRDQHRALVREAARASIVLLKNNGKLPFSTSLRRYAVIGADAIEGRLGGYTLDDVRGTSVFTAMAERFGGDRVALAAGPGRGAFHSSAGQGVDDTHAADGLTTIAPSQSDSLRGEYWSNPTFTGPPTITRAESSVDFRWTLNSPGRGIPFDWYSARITGRLRVPESGARQIAVEGNDGYRLFVDDSLVIDNWRKQSYRRSRAVLPLAPGSTHRIRLEFYETTGNARLRLLWDAGQRDDSDARIERAVEAARQADAAIIVAGIEEGEFRDRSSLALPGRQEELILRVAATGRPVVVVLIGGSAITMHRWIDSVDAVLLAWYPGELGGPAITDVIFGDYNPAGRLPITFPTSEGQLPLTYNHKPTGRGDDYVDGSGMAAFPFGFGLSYARFEYSDLRITPDSVPADGVVRIRLKVRNVGTRAGDEVPQLYVRDILASVARPLMELKGFSRVHLRPGQEQEVEFRLPVSELRMLDASMRWLVEPGTFRIMVGTSSEDIRLRGSLEVTP